MELVGVCDVSITLARSANGVLPFVLDFPERFDDTGLFVELEHTDELFLRFWDRSASESAVRVISLTSGTSR